MSKTKITVRMRKEATEHEPVTEAKEQETEPEPATEAKEEETESESMLGQKDEQTVMETKERKLEQNAGTSNGKYVMINTLSFMKLNGNMMKQSSIRIYKYNIVKLNTALEEQGYLKDSDKHAFYWEKYCDDDMMIVIIRILHEQYNITSAVDLRPRMTPVMTCINMVEDIPATCVAKWVSFKEHLMKDENYDAFCEEHNINQRKKNTSRSEREVPDWKTLRARFHKVSITNGLDYRVRVITAMFKHGYVMRSGALFNTRVFMTSTEDTAHNYLDLATGEWTINETKSNRGQVVKLPDDLMIELRELVNIKHPFFAKGWLIGKNDGEPYTVHSLPMLKQWRMLKLPDNVLCRKSYETWQWCDSNMNKEEAVKKSLELDHRPSVAIRYYTPKHGK